MALADRLKVAPERRRGARCTVCLALDAAKGKDHTALAAALTDKLPGDVYAWPERELKAELEAEGYKIGAGAIGKHRREHGRPGEPR